MDELPVAMRSFLPMRTEERSEAEREPVTRQGPGGVPFFTQPGVLAGGAALISLVVGIVLGRATVHVPNERATQVERPVVAAASKPAEAEAEPEPEFDPTDLYRIRFNRLPKPDDGVGFTRGDTKDRQMASMADKEARLHFDLAASPSEYALAAILQVKGGSSAKLQTRLDGHSLATWTLSGDWALYSAPVSKELLAMNAHDLTLLASELPAGAAVNVDSVALLPVADQIEIGISKAAGHLVDGFSKLEGRTVWSLGPRSRVGVVLAPQAATVYQLRVRGYALPVLAPLDVTASVNGTALGAAAFTPKMGETTWEVPAQALRAGVNEIEFSYPKTAQPAGYNPKSKDTRELAVRYSKIALTPAK
jgi:hypothetical protein